MTWPEEVRQAEEEVRREFSDPRLNDVPVQAVEGYDYAAQWGSWNPETRVIRIYRPAFDRMPDPENRHRQLRDVLRHEFRHALGAEGHLLSDGLPPPRWYDLDSGWGFDL